MSNLWFDFRWLIISFVYFFEHISYFLLTFDVFFAQFFNIVFRIVLHFQPEGKFSGRGKKWKKWRYLTIENHVRYKHCVDSDIKVRISKVLSRYQKITFRMETRYSRTLVLLPRLSPIGKIVHLIEDNSRMIMKSEQASTLTFFLTCPFGQLTKTCRSPLILLWGNLIQNLP